MNATKTRQPTARAVREILFGFNGRVTPANQARVRVDCSDVDRTAVAIEAIRRSGYRVRHLGPTTFYVIA